MGIVLAQNKFGGAFFLPKKYRRRAFDYSGAVEPGTECAICMVDINAGEPSMLTPCGHAFHRECLETWMHEQMICPVCRAALPPEDDSSDEEPLTDLHPQ